MILITNRRRVEGKLCTPTQYQSILAENKINKYQKTFSLWGGEWLFESTLVKKSVEEYLLTGVGERKRETRKEERQRKGGCCGR